MSTITGTNGNEFLDGAFAASPWTRIDVNDDVA